MKTTFLKQNMGVDISKDDFKCSFSALTERFDIVTIGAKTFLNSSKGYTDLLEWIKARGQAGVSLTFTLEATGVYYEALAYFLIDHGCSLYVVLPNQSKKYAESFGTKSKTDKIDAKILSKMGIERKLLPWQPLSANLLKLKQLTREREAIVQERTMVNNQLHAYKHQGKINSNSITRSQKRIAFFNDQIKEIEREIAQIVKQDEKLHQKLNNLQTIPGVGLITSVIIVAETNGFASIRNIKQLTSFAGLDIQIAESGLWKGKSRISKKGNRHIRKALYFPAFTKIKFDSQTHKYYEKLKAKKAKPMIAAVAVQRKLLALIYTLWRKDEIFSPDYCQPLVA